MMMLDDLLKPQRLNKGFHDSIINKIAFNSEKNNDILTVFKSAYFKFGGYEGDIDLLQLMFDHNIYCYDSWEEVPFANSTLLVYEVKSNNCRKNYVKALSQLRKEKSFLTEFTNYNNIITLYAYGTSNGYYQIRSEHV